MATKEIIVGVTGGVAAFKTAAMVSRLVQDDYSVRVVMTEAATQFVGTATFAALTGKSVVTKTFDPQFPLGAHIELARNSDLFCIAPATANFLANTANGVANDLLTTLYLCFMGPVVMAPAMNCEMWDKAAVQRNVNQLKSDGVTLVGPEEGWLSCRVKGKGRMSEPDSIIETIISKLP
jgi:phosphopantothenoylcysteine decarboxylase/phosphopantothenate--cysteine ligase